MLPIPNVHLCLLFVFWNEFTFQKLCLGSLKLKDLHPAYRADEGVDPVNLEQLQEALCT